MRWTTKRELRHRLEAEKTRSAAIEAERVRWQQAFTGLSFGLPRVGLPWGNTDCDGESIQIRRAEDDPDAIIISTSWHRDIPGKVLTTHAALDNWEVRMKCAAAILAAGPPEEVRPSLSLILGAG